MAADYILRHSRRESALDSTVRRGLCPEITPDKGERYKLVITGAIIMLIGVLVGYGLGHNTSDNL